MDFCELQKRVSEYYQAHCPSFLVWYTPASRPDGIYQKFTGCKGNFRPLIDILFKQNSIKLLFARYNENASPEKENLSFKKLKPYSSLTSFLCRENFQEVVNGTRTHIEKELHFEDASELIAYLDSFFDKLSKLIV